MRTCAKCGKSEEQVPFFLSIRYRCKPCHTAANKISREKHLEARRAQKREYQRENREKMNRTSREWAEKNRPRVYAAIRKYRASGRSLEMERARRKANPEPARARVRTRRARLQGAEGTHTSEDVERLLQSQRHRCAACGGCVASGYHVDHKVPVSRGGSNWPDNLQILCPRCNLSKGARTPEEWNSLPPARD